MEYITLSNNSFLSINIFSILLSKRDFLNIYNKLIPTKYEECESIDMLRVLEHGYSVRMVPTFEESQAVDTIDDLKLVEGILSKRGNSI